MCAVRDVSPRKESAMPRSAAGAALLLVLAAVPALAEDSTPPLIRHSPIARAGKGDSVTISAQMEDESEIFAPTLYYRYPGAKSYSNVAMGRKGDSFTATVQATADIEYWIEAYDEFGNGPTREGTPDRPHRIGVADRSAPRVAREPPRPPPPPPPKPPPPPEPEPQPEPVVAHPPRPPPPPVPLPPPLPPEPSKPVYRQWWFWTGTGVIVAGAAVASFFVLQPAPVHQDVFGAKVTY